MRDFFQPLDIVFAQLANLLHIAFLAARDKENA